MHFDIECLRDLKQCFSEVEENFCDSAGEIIVSHLMELYPDSSINEDNLSCYEQHDSLEELADFHGADYDIAFRRVYEDNADPDDFPELDEDGNPTGDLLDVAELTDQQREDIAEEFKDKLRAAVEKQLEHDSIQIWEISGGLYYLSFDPYR